MRAGLLPAQALVERARPAACLLPWPTQVPPPLRQDITQKPPPRKVSCQPEERQQGQWEDAEEGWAATAQQG